MSTPSSAPAVTLVSPFPPGDLYLAWAWLNENEDANFDDYGPPRYAEFERQMLERAKTERTWGVIHAGKLCGIVAYLPITPRLGTWHGICFVSEVHGTGIARAALRVIIKELFDSGVEKITASYFADNSRVERFLLALGAEYEGTLRKHTMRHGQAIDMRVVGFFKGDI